MASLARRKPVGQPSVQSGALRAQDQRGGKIFQKRARGHHGLLGTQAGAENLALSWHLL